MSHDVCKRNAPICRLRPIVRNPNAGVQALIRHPCAKNLPPLRVRKDFRRDDALSSVLHNQSVRCRLTSRAQARGTDDVARDSDHGSRSERLLLGLHLVAALGTQTGPAIRLFVTLYALRAFHRWFSGLMRFPRIRPVGFRLYTTEPNSFRNPPDRSNACSDLLGIIF